MERNIIKKNTQYCVVPFSINSVNILMTYPKILAVDCHVCTVRGKYAAIIKVKPIVTEMPHVS